jgi:predicted CopG family antitoxin
MKKKIAITIDEEVYEKLKELSEKEYRTLSSQINKILKDFISFEG